MAQQIKIKTIKKILNFLKKIFTHNYCDNCGFTKDKLYVIELFNEAGLIQCNKCSREQLKNK